MSTTTNSEGGYTVATEVARTVLDALKAGPAPCARWRRHPDLRHRRPELSDLGRHLGNRRNHRPERHGDRADVSFGVKTLTVYKYSSKVVAVPFELLQDSNVDIEAFVVKRLATRLGRITNTHFTTGTGSSQPNGVVTAATTGYTAANSTSQVTAITYDSLVDLQHSVDPAYRETRACKWMMNDASLKVLRKMKDGSGRPIFVPGYEVGVPGGMPDTLLGSRSSSTRTSPRWRPRRSRSCSATSPTT
jgi:predicted phage gp36 major capsid-like protein